MFAIIVFSLLCICSIIILNDFFLKTVSNLNHLDSLVLLDIKPSTCFDIMTYNLNQPQILFSPEFMEYYNANLVKNDSLRLLGKLLYEHY